MPNLSEGLTAQAFNERFPSYNAQLPVRVYLLKLELTELEHIKPL